MSRHGARYRYGGRVVCIGADGEPYLPTNLPEIFASHEVVRSLAPLPRHLRARVRALGWNPQHDPDPAVAVRQAGRSGDPAVVLRRLDEVASGGSHTVPASTDQGGK